LEADSADLERVLDLGGGFDPAHDAKLNALFQLLTGQHADEKVLVFSQFADTVDYLARELRQRGVDRLGAVTGDDEDPTRWARAFSPVSNQHAARDQLRVLLATDVLSEGQNLQDAHVVVNFDLPWAIIRLIQRAGRVDRIGQQSRTITCWSFLPAAGVEQLIQLRGRIRQRLTENQDVVGTDETFFEGDEAKAGWTCTTRRRACSTTRWTTTWTSCRTPSRSGRTRSRPIRRWSL
jgi:superfamily II DNA/RNA helicase